MLVLNLCCAFEHRFEGWFGSADDFEAQLARGLVECPICGDQQIERRPSAPRLNLRGAAGESAAPTTAAAARTDDAHTDIRPQIAALQRQLHEVVRQVIANTEDVGTRFAEEARRIHYGESEQRGIRGQASRAESEALADEGIAVMALPLPPDEKLQ